MTEADAVTRLNAALEGRYRIERELGEGGIPSRILKALVVVTFLLQGVQASAQTPDRPLLVELDLSPALIAVAGGSLADETVDELVVDRWVPGLTLGYRVHDRLTLSYSYHPGFDLIVRESWGFTGAGDLDIPPTLRLTGLPSPTIG